MDWPQRIANFENALGTQTVFLGSDERVCGTWMSGVNNARDEAFLAKRVQALIPDKRSLVLVSRESQIAPVGPLAGAELVLVRGPRKKPNVDLRTLTACIASGGFLVWVGDKLPIYHSDQLQLSGLIGYFRGVNRPYEMIAILQKF